MPNSTPTKKTSPKDTPAAPQKGHVFVVMPFGGHFDTCDGTVYKPAIEVAGLVPRRADDRPTRETTKDHAMWRPTRTGRRM
jgi:hypothetical protein